jgi:hypothetical protein
MSAGDQILLPWARRAFRDWRGTAAFSPCGRYRYTLTRTWSERDDARLVAFVLLNPSTATAEVSDPTIRRCMGFAYSWGADGLWILNLFGWRSTDPLGLLETPDPVGPGNDDAIRAVLSSPRLGPVVCGWGDGKRPVADLVRERSDRVLSMIHEARPPELVTRLGQTTRTGAPRHPLYLRSETELEEHA